eukprot:TRINITY_DN865_c0_g1_i2.p1 TRINITY_DN865_c0_g1~~TRINITY_DN865_c0_g1_i2.p1  ORF type:complete len:923 (-),score=310.26 TRINITY_DN865_c0_g1_i2:106-2874(-)
MEKKASKAEVKKTVDELNIQVDNLCQFLPQDKVVSFAGLSPQNLLRETEHVLGTSHLTNWHNELIQLKKDEKELENRTTSHKVHLEDLEKQQSAVRKDVLRFQERQKHLERLEQFEMKKPWIEYEVSRLEAVALMDQKNQTKEAYDKFCRENRGTIQKRINQCKSNLKSIDNERDANMKAQKEHDKKRRDLGTKIDSIADREEGFQVELQNLANRAEDRKKQAEKMKKEIVVLKNKIAELPNQEEAKRKTEEINQMLKDNASQSKQVQEKSVGISQQIRDVKGKEKAIKDQLQTISDFNRQQTAKLNQNPVLKQVHDWIRNHRADFEREVYGPVFVSVNVKDPLHASYLDMVIPAHIQQGFITQSSKDRELISRECLDKLKLNVTIINNPPDDFQIKPRALSPEQLRKYGFSGYLDQLFDAPPAVKQAIFRNSFTSETPAGSNKTVAADVLEQLRLPSFFTPEGYYVSKTSKYGNKNTSTSFTPLKAAKLLSGVDLKQKEQLENQLQDITQELDQLGEQHTEANTEERELANQRSTLQNEKLSYSDVFKTRSKMEESLRFKESELRSINEDEDTSQEEGRIRRDIHLAAANKLKSNHQMKMEVLSITEKFLELDFIILKRTELQAELQLLEFENRRISEEEEELRRAAELSEQEFKAASNRVKEAKRKAEAKVAMTEEIKQLFLQLPNTLDEIEAAITDARNKADMNYSTNPHIITQYEKRQAEIDELKAKFENEEETLQNSKAKIEELKGKWEGELEPLIAKVNKSFEKYFRQIGCLGEVVLAKDPNMDFEQYAIEIRVRFRDNEPLQKLDPNHQSGGERSVSTMLYLVSLQEITPCPFRLVDEINQGMDAVNERMIFQVVSEVACRPGVPQYFLITPKLLPNLKFTPEMTILCVFNGPWQVAHQAWRIDKFREKAQFNSN